MLNCLPGPPHFDTDLGYQVYYSALARGDSDSDALRLGLLVDALQTPEIAKLLQNLGEKNDD